MTQTLFDTHAFVRRLEDAKFGREQAEAVARAFQDAMSEGVATKADLALLEERFEHRFQVVEERFDTRLKDLELRLTPRMGGMAIATVGLLIAYDQLWGG